MTSEARAWSRPVGSVSLVGCILFFLLISACAAGQELDGTDPTLELISQKHSVGQSFFATPRGLRAIDVYLAPGAAGDAQIMWHLRNAPSGDSDLAASSLTLGQTSEPGRYRFSLPVIAGSEDAYYYLEIGAVSGSSTVGSLRDAAGINGALNVYGEPTPGQLAYAPVYSLPQVLGGLLVAAGNMFRWVLFALVVFVLPGLGLLLLAALDSRGYSFLGFPERVIGAASLTLALYPVLFLWAYTFGFRTDIRWYAWTPAALVLALLALRYRLWSPKLRSAPHGLKQWAHGPNFWPDIGLILSVVAVIAVRLQAVSGLDAPLWGDSVQHAVIAQLMVDNGGLFDSWQPYAPYVGLSVHFGFSALVAVFASASGLNVPQATLIAGQIVNAIAVLALYPLAVRLAKGNRWAGVGAVVAAGLLSMMPAFYVNWGRYAQLAGQAILPAALWLLWLAVWPGKAKVGMLALAGLALAGMTLTYYRMVYYYAAFIAAWLVFWMLPLIRTDLRRWVSAFLRLAIIAVVGVALFAPWLPRLLSSEVGQAATTAATNVATIEEVVAEYQIWREIADYVSPLLLFITGLAVGWGMVRRDTNMLLLVAWMAGMSLLAATRLINLPGARFLANFAVLIALYMPVGLLVGWLIAQIAERAKSRTAQFVLLVGLSALAALTLNAQSEIVDTQFVMVTRPDMRAMEWIDHNITADALFLVEGFSIYDRSSAVGSDAGWWIPLLARRSNTMPPQYALMGERPEQPGYTESVTDLVTALEDNSIGSAQSLALLCDWNVTHAYIGQGQGLVGFGVNQLFSPEELSSSPEFERIYRQDHVEIYSFDRSICATVDG
jgi:hypothetical protein